ncbi:SanA/YdcF family protein [Kaistella antarctica]|uniref:SanA protein n=1 Tax=Kaistella antarctica TaxID=266748 RepID=A0A448NNN3_9FLAO|nr:ElyC/SanA/YdcF family protein [Kaistella antarctica]KEY19728.1 SanA protein [Kaistella antarctica]SEV98500.1 SanA protein [Kaistella antarctica]VEH96633.1 vancomycin high temperature exclusion protein [Kaistella antarctica]
MKKILDLFKSFFNLVEIGILLMILANIWVFAVTNGRTYTKISKIPPRQTALVLGTSPKMRSGVSNPYFTARMDAAALLYHHGKIKKIIVSGEKSKGYDEPAAMKDYLIYQEGVPENIIIQDPKGFKTQASIKNCLEVYHQKDVIVVSQGFHNLRALFYARNSGMNALGFDAQDVLANKSFYRNQSREFLARVVAVIYYIFNIEQKV